MESRWASNIMISKFGSGLYHCLKLTAVAVSLLSTLAGVSRADGAAAQCESPDSWWAATYKGAEAYTYHALKCHDEHNYAAAAAQWKKAIGASSPGDQGLFQQFVWLGSDYYLSDKAAGALGSWATGLRLAKKQPGYQVAGPPDAKANSLFETGRYKEALSAYANGALSDYNPILFSDSAYETLYKKAVAEALGGDYASSERDLRNLLAVAPDAYMAHFLLGDLLFMRGKPVDAKAERVQTLFSFSADAPTSSISDRWHGSHWAALALLTHYVAAK